MSEVVDFLPTPRTLPPLHPPSPFSNGILSSKGNKETKYLRTGERNRKNITKKDPTETGGYPLKLW